MDVNEALRIAGEFHKFLETGDKKIIENFSVTEIRMALNKISHGDSHKQWYKAMENRLNELLEIEKEKARKIEESTNKRAESIERRKEKWFDRAIGFVLGLLSAIILKLFFG